MRLFISHIHEESAIASAIQQELLACFAAQVKIFQAGDIPLGTNWFNEVRSALSACDVILVLFSKHSIHRPWINIEAGHGVMAGKNVIPLCHSGLSKENLPVIYSLLQAVDLVVAEDVGRLLERLAQMTPAGRFLGDKPAAVARWVEQVTDVLSKSPRPVVPRHDPPCVWVLGSNRDLPPKQAQLNKRVIRHLAQAFLQRRLRVVLGRSGALDALGAALADELDGTQVYGHDRETLAELGDASAMHKNTPDAPPNPVVLLGSLRSTRGLREVFLGSVGRLPDVAIVCGGSERGRTKEEIEEARRSGIPLFPLRFTGGVAATTEASLDPGLLAKASQIEETSRDYAVKAQLICDLAYEQASLGRSRESPATPKRT